METAVAVVIVAVIGVLGQLLLKRQDWARLDEVARRAEAAADANIVANRETAENTAGIGQKLDIIHALVNSDKTEAMKTLLVQRQLVAELRRAAGQDVPEEETEAIAALVKELAERANQQDAIDRSLGQ